MKKILGLLLAGFAMNAMAGSVCVDNKNTLNCSEGVINGMTHNGDVNFEKTTVNGSSVLQGNTEINNATLGSLTLNGNASVTESKLNNMTVTGNVYAKNVVVNGDTNVLGKFYAANTTISANTKLVGDIDCDHCLFEKDVSLLGNVVVSDSEVLGSLNLDSDRNAFYESKLNNIVMKKPAGNHKQIISLNRGTTVNNIRFEGKGGLVMLDDTSKITGTVEGGTVVKSKG
jgi:hypothetical protein